MGAAQCWSCSPGQQPVCMHARSPPSTLLPGALLFLVQLFKAGADCRGVANSPVLLIPLLSNSIRRFSIISLPLGLDRLLPSLK